jgi:hypothetical protein
VRAELAVVARRVVRKGRRLDGVELGSDVRSDVIQFGLAERPRLQVRAVRPDVQVAGRVDRFLEEFSAGQQVERELAVVLERAGSLGRLVVDDSEVAIGRSRDVSCFVFPVAVPEGNLVLFSVRRLRDLVDEFDAFWFLVICQLVVRERFDV